MATPEFSILGAGALGSLYAAALKRAGTGVELIMRAGRQPAAQVTLELLEGTATSQVQLPCTSADQTGAIRWLLVTTKAYQAEQAVLSVSHRFTPETRVVLLHNGLGVCEALQARYPKLTILLGTSTHGALLQPDNTSHDILRVQHTGHGDTRLGLAEGNLPSEEGQYLLTTLNNALPECTWHQQILPSLWTKLAINSVINPLTALHRCRNGALAKPEFESVIAPLIQEFCQVAEASGFAFNPESLTQTLHQVIANTAENYSSMNRDLAAGRRSEIDQITGYLLTQASAHKLSLPCHQSLYRQIIAMEKQRSSEYQLQPNDRTS